MIELRTTKNEALVMGFMLSDFIWNRFTDDLSVKEQYKPDFSSQSLWFEVYMQSEFIGLIMLKNTNLSTVEVHPNLMKGKGRYFKEVFKELFRFILITPKSLNKVSVTIPFSRKINYNCAKNFGFIDEGINRQSFLKDGVFHDQWVLGLTRKEIEGLV